MQSAGQLVGFSPVSHTPFPQTAAHVVVVGDSLVVVVVVAQPPAHASVDVDVDDASMTVEVLVVVELVDVVAQPPGPHASQQLGNALGQPPRSRQRAALDDRRHVVLLPCVRQHATAPGRPHVERAAHWRTPFRHCGRSVRAPIAASATVRAQLTYWP